MSAKYGIVRHEMWTLFTIDSYIARDGRLYIGAVPKPQSTVSPGSCHDHQFVMWFVVVGFGPVRVSTTRTKKVLECA